jgi:protein involved in sex pheromone biosynthesis
MKRKIGWLVLVLVFAVSGCNNRQDNTTIQEVKNHNRQMKQDRNQRKMITGRLHPPTKY